MSRKNLFTYNLYSIERRYKKDTLVSYYFQPNRKIIKQYKPIDINGERLRLSLQTGEITNYKLSQILACRNTSLRRTNTLVNMILEMNDFEWFWTLTFDKEKIDRTNDLQVFTCYKKYIHNLKVKYPNFKYICFPERHHDEDNCLHFHLLTAGITAKQMGLVNSGKVCCHWAKKFRNGVWQHIGNCSREFFEKTKDNHILTDTDGETLFNITTFAYGYTTVSRICSKEKCNSYVKKYVKKDLGSVDVFKKRFYYSSNLNVPEVVKKLIGADFENPVDIKNLTLLEDDLIVKNAKGQPYVSDYNVLQVRIDNEIKDNLDKGLVPLSIDEDLPF